MDGYACLVPFDSPEAEFARGFEAGRIWALARSAPSEPIEELVHASNAEMMLRIGEATGRVVRARLEDDIWITVEFEPSTVTG